MDLFDPGLRSSRLAAESATAIPHGQIGTEAELAKFCQADYLRRMGTMNISLPDALKAFVDEQVSQRGYGTSSEYVRELIRRDQDRLQLRNLLLAGVASAPGAQADRAYFDGLRERVKGAAKTGARG